MEHTQENDLIYHDISDEEWREYEWTFLDRKGQPHTRYYRIEKPAVLVMRKNGCYNHRIVDSRGVVHLCPAPGEYGCVIRWEVQPGFPSVQF